MDIIINRGQSETMMLVEYLLLSSCYICSACLMLSFIYKAYQHQQFSFHWLFSIIYFSTFYLGFPCSMLLALLFDVTLPNYEMLLLTLLTALVSYLLYYFVYKRVNLIRQAVQKRQDFAKSEAILTASLLCMIGLFSLIAFISMNGLLIFKLEKYSQIFSSIVQGIPLKRFFYFFIAGLLVFFFLYENKKTWLAFLLIGAFFGGFAYLAVGGTRANLGLAIVLFLLLGLYKGYLSYKWLLFIGASMIGLMFLLALARYNLNVSGREAFFTFLYLTRDTFSPWENVALLFIHPLEYQGLMPIVRDFYVYLPNWLWADKPDQIVNTATYFTHQVLGNASALVISPTLLGSFYIMGGFTMIAIGMALTGLIIKLFDQLLAYAKQHIKHSSSAILQAYCFANLFNLIVLVRDGFDAFCSRLVFFSLIFGCCWLVARAIDHIIINKHVVKEK